MAAVVSPAEAAAEAAGAQPLAGWAEPLSGEQRRDFAAARALLGPGCEIVRLSSGHEPSGLLPHLAALDRWE